MIDFLGSINLIGVDPAAFRSEPTKLEQVAGRVEGFLEPLIRFNDPKGVYAHCFCEFR